MKKFAVWLIATLAMLFAMGALLGCGGPASSSTTEGGSTTDSGGTGQTGSSISALAVESFLADITRNVAGERLTVDTLIPLGSDPHSFEPSPADVRLVGAAQLIVVNGAGLEAFLGNLVSASGTDARIVEASAGLEPRTAELGDEEGEPDPHFWLDPILVKTYVENIRAGLTEVDPAGAEVYSRNAAAYSAQLDELDAWIRSTVEELPVEQRLLVTNHESLGYFADRYGFQVVGALLPGITTGASPSAQELAQLQNDIRSLGVKAVILEIGTDPKLAQQVAGDTGVKIVTDIYTESLSDEQGPASTYLDMMRHNTTVIVDALL